MRRPANAVRLACGHPMCDPGTVECRTRDILAATPGDVEQLRAAALAALDRPGCAKCGRPKRDHDPEENHPFLSTPEQAELWEQGPEKLLARLRTRTDPEWTGGAELHRSDCETNSYDNGPCDCGTGGLTAELLVLVLDDVRREQRLAISAWRRTAPTAEIADRVAENWRRSRPGFARLLDLTDRP